MNNTLLIETKNLTKTFLGREVIRGCNMSVEKGKIYGFLGANGAGKTTVFKLLSGLLTPTMGTVRILGMDMTLLISSHILTEVEHIADTIGVIVDGTIVREVSMEKVKAENPSGLEDYFMDILTGRQENENTY